MIDVKFFSSVGIPVYVADEKGIDMINKSDIEAFEYYNEVDAANERKEAFKKVKKDLEKALEALRTSLHYIHETHEYESDLLDNMCSDLENHVTELQGILDAEKV